MQIEADGQKWSGFPLVGKIGLSPHVPLTVLTQKCRFCHFHAVFGHFVQIAPPPTHTHTYTLVYPNWETLMVAVKLLDIMSGSITFENILSIRVLEWLVILVGCKIKGIYKLEARESKNSFFLIMLIIIQEVNIKISK